MALIKLTEAVVKNLEPEPGAVQSYFWDTATTGFGIVVGTKAKTFVARAWVHQHGKAVKRRVVIGHHGEARDADGVRWNVETARREAFKLLGAMKNGHDPNEAKKASRASGPTLRDALEYHLGKMERGENRRKKACSPRSIATMKGEVENHFAQWMDRPLISITADVIEDIQHRVERDTAPKEGSNPKNPPGRALSNRLLAHIRAIWRSWHKRYGLPVANPAERLIQAELKPRENRIGNADLAAWYEKVQAMTNTVRRDLQLVALFTGIRADGVRNLRWDDIDFDDDRIEVQKAKGDRPYVVPMVGTVRRILEARQEENKILMGPYGGDHGFVFPSLTAAAPFEVIAIAEPKERKTVKDADGEAVRVQYLPGIQALRKTYNSIAAEIGISLEGRMRLLNHAGRGVNAKHYTFTEPEWTSAEVDAVKIESAIWNRIKGVKPEKKRKPKLQAV